MTYVGTLQKALDKLAEEGKGVGLVIHSWPGKTQATAHGHMGNLVPSRLLGAVLTPLN